jgi:hypothetical protein
MKKEPLIAVSLIAILTLSGCGIYASTARSGIPNEPARDPIVSLPDEIKQESSAPAPVKPAEPSAVRLTKGEAEAIALKHAGFTADQVKGLKTELDIDPGIAHYEVEFHVGQWEYDYDIHAETGAVLAFEKDD